MAWEQFLKDSMLGEIDPWLCAKVMISAYPFNVGLAISHHFHEWLQCICPIWNMSYQIECSITARDQPIMVTLALVLSWRSCDETNFLVTWGIRHWHIYYACGERKLILYKPMIWMVIPRCFFHKPLSSLREMKPERKASNPEVGIGPYHRSWAAMLNTLLAATFWKWKASLQFIWKASSWVFTW